VPIYDVFWFFVNGIKRGSLNTRASSISFNFLLALGPALIFFLTFIPYIPISNFQRELMELISDIIPLNSYFAIETLTEELSQKRSGLQIFGLLTALFFAQKGIGGMIQAFNATSHSIENRPWIEQKLVSVIMVFIITLLVVTALLLLFFGKEAVNKLGTLGILKMNLNYYLLVIGRWIIILSLCFFSISFLYYLAPARKTKWRFISAGSSLAALLAIITSIVFSWFVNNFANFDNIFGSIGALIALMLWINFNALTLLIGFELNASINHAQLQVSQPQVSID
jgi:membrane protein